jgi:type I restriction enzyme, R subunit
MDADFLEELITTGDPRKTKEIEIQVIARLRRHPNHPKFINLGKRLEDIKNRLEKGLLASIEYLKMLLEIAKEIVQTEKEVDPVDEQNNAIAVLSELFYETRNDATPKIVEQVVADIDNIVRIVRFPGWQKTHAGEREVKKALRSTLLKYQLHKDQELFDKAYGYIKEYY